MEEKTPGSVISLLKFQMRSQQSHKLGFAKTLKSEIKTQLSELYYPHLFYRYLLLLYASNCLIYFLFLIRILGDTKLVES